MKHRHVVKLEVEIQVGSLQMLILKNYAGDMSSALYSKVYMGRHDTMKNINILETITAKAL